LQYFEKQGRSAEAGLLYVDAAHIANISESFSESLGYITNAIKIFEEEELHELAGNAQLRKGTLLYTWAQNGNPQFYKPAIESYQQALQVFKQEETPDVFADIHHNLAVLYSEMPADPKKRGIWAGVASASFQEALNYFTKESFPYQYGMICNNFGNALTKFPPAIHSDNYEKALFYYQEALSVRTADYPYERAISLLNYLEASWNVSNNSDDFNEERYQDMLDKAKEVKVLVDDQAMNEEVDKHLTMLEELKMLAKNA
jgi:tetratricopeptide (TPR) repeat protein